MKIGVKVSLGLVVSLVAFGSSCSSHNDSSNPSGDQQALYNSDVAGFAQIDSSLHSNSIRTFDEQNNGLFTKIFGGIDAASVEQYYQARINYAFTQDEVLQATLEPQLPDQAWATVPTTHSQILASETSKLGALNISTMFWLESVVANTPVELMVNGQAIPITSSRTGVMMLGEGYVPTISDGQGNSHPLPPEYRQAILVHEGRHSDCTDGLSEREVEIMRNATSSDDFHRQIPLPHCGHTHVICPSGTYKGLAACDVERYGAYTVGAVYTAAMIDAQTDEVEKKIMQQTALDYESRFLGSATQSPDEDAPNMSSAGVTP